MAGHLIPPPELAAVLPENLTHEQGIEAWVDLMDTCDQFLVAGLSRTLDPEGDIRSAYRDWYRQQMEAHDHVMRRMMEEFLRRGAASGGR